MVKNSTSVSARTVALRTLPSCNNASSPKLSPLYSVATRSSCSASPAFMDTETLPLNTM